MSRSNNIKEMSTPLKLFVLLALAASIWVAEAQDYKSDQEYEKLKSYAVRSNFYPDGNSGQLQLLVMCIDRGDAGLLDKLLDAAPDFANVNEGMASCPPIFWASFRGNTNIIAVLLKYGADIKKKGTNWEISALHIAHDSQTVELLLSHGVDIESMDIHGQTPLMWAAKHGNLEVAETLLKQGARLDKYDDANWTALEFAQAFGHSNVVALLKSKGAPSSRKSKQDFPFEAVAGSWLQYGTNHPFAQGILVNGDPVNEHFSNSTH